MQLNYKKTTNQRSFISNLYIYSWSLIGCFALFSMCLMISSKIHADTTLILEGSQSSGAVNSSNEKESIQKKKNKQSLRRGKLDPHCPRKVVYEPTLVDLPNNYQLPNEFRVRNGQLDLKSLTADVLSGLSGFELGVLVNYLSRIEVKVKWYDKDGWARSGKNQKKSKIRDRHWDKSNAAAALAFDFLIHGEVDLFSDFVKLAPLAVIQQFRGEATALIDGPLAATLLKEMVFDLDTGNSGQIAQGAALLTQFYLKYWANKDVEKLTTKLTELLRETHQRIYLHESLVTEQVVGVILGSVLAGALKHAEVLKSKELKRLVIINAISNLVWAATAYLYSIPVAGWVISPIIGTISVGVVAWAVVHNLKGIRYDYLPNIKEIEGFLEFSSLEQAQKGGSECKLNVLLTLGFMKAAIHVNGLAD